MIMTVAPEFRSAGRRLGGSAIVLAMAAGDMVLIVALASGIPGAVIAPAHLLLVAAGSLLCARATGDWSMASACGAATFALGPVGAAFALGGCLIAAHAARDQSLSAWHQKLVDRGETDKGEMLYRDIVEGRAFNAASAPRRFAEVMAAGDVGARQRVLGLLATHDGDVRDDLLKAGLSARDLAVRAPAAALVARLREAERQ